MTKLYTPKTYLHEKSAYQTPKDALASRESASASLPSLYSNNTIGTDPNEKLDTVQALSCLLTPYHKRQAHTLFSNVQRLVTKVAPTIGHVGFLTLTFPDNVTDPKEAYRRFNSMRTNFLSKWSEITDWICVKERQRRGAWHYHLICVFSSDIRDGLNFEEIKERNYSSAGGYIRGLWKDLREKLPEYGFGRSELLPVKSNAEAMGRYVGKYISKHMGQKTEQDKGVRLVNYSRGWERNSIRFAWHSKNASEWRRKLKKFADYLGCSEIYQISEKLGPGWAYRYSEEIRDIDFTLLENGGEVCQEFQDRLVARVQGNKDLRKKMNDKWETFLSEEKNEDVRNFEESLRNRFIDEEKKRRKHAKKSKVKSAIILNQKWFCDEDYRKEVIEEVRLRIENSLTNFLNEAYQNKHEINNKTSLSAQNTTGKEVP